MTTTISAKELPATLPEVVERVRGGARFTVIYRRRPAFQIAPVDDPGTPPVCRSSDGREASTGC